jgi:hypothetical protein
MFKQIGYLYAFNFMHGVYDISEEKLKEIEEAIEDANDLIECISSIYPEDIDTDDEEEISNFFEEMYQKRLDAIHDRIDYIVTTFFGIAIDEVKYKTIVNTGGRLKMYKVAHIRMEDLLEEET